MCLAVPARLIDCRGTKATADLHGNRVEISTMLIPPCKPGDWVLLHAGFAIQTLDEQEAQETWAVIKDLRTTGGKR
jgi:hydrogenase expression/formation protein HypC